MDEVIWKRLSILGLFLGLLVSSVVLAQDLVDLNGSYTVAAGQDKPPREEIFKKVGSELALNAIKELLGDSKFNRSQKLIQTRILPQLDRYIPILRLGTTDKLADGSEQINVSARISIKDLKSILLKESLISASEGTPTAISFVTFIDRVNSRSYRWWLPDPEGSQGLKEPYVQFTEILRDEMGEKGFFLADSGKRDLKRLIPAPFLSDSFRNDDLTFLSDFLKYQIVITGRLLFARDGNGYRVNSEVQALQGSNGRLIAEVVRSFPLKGGAFDWSLQMGFESIAREVAKELVGQIFEAWEKGAIGSDYIQILFSGNFEFLEIEKLKATLSRLGDVKLLREKSFEKGAVKFEVNSDSSSDVLSKKISSVLGQSYSVDVSGAVIEIQKR